MDTAQIPVAEDTFEARVAGPEDGEQYVSGPYRFEIFEGVGHWIAESEPDRLNALLVEHLAAAG